MSCQWTCYLLWSLDSNRTYVGATPNLENRLGNHNSGKGAKYTRGQTWVPLMYISGFESKNACLSFEAGWKRISKNRSQKRLESIEPVINLSYSSCAKHNRVVDLLYFLNHTTYIDHHYVFDRERNKPLFFSSLTCHIFDKELLELNWPVNVEVRMIA